MVRLLILLTMPLPLSAQEGEGWLREAMAALSAHHDVQDCDFSSLASGSRRCPCNWDRLIELHLTDGAEASGWADNGPCAEWLADLRSLRLAPVVLLADSEPIIPDTERA